MTFMPYIIGYYCFIILQIYALVITNVLLFCIGIVVLIIYFFLLDKKYKSFLITELAIQNKYVHNILTYTFGDNLYPNNNYFMATFTTHTFLFEFDLLARYGELVYKPTPYFKMAMDISYLDEVQQKRIKIKYDVFEHNGKYWVRHNYLTGDKKAFTIFNPSVNELLKNTKRDAEMLINEIARYTHI
jgi:hypothetical protein